MPPGLRRAFAGSRHRSAFDPSGCRLPTATPQPQDLGSGRSFRVLRGGAAGGATRPHSHGRRGAPAGNEGQLRTLPGSTDPPSSH
ncbi:Hypothetical predicted protein [Marmota monax]|uniref:Uncharacterized protein n=1 Tax=Marmota monax TaxID=9995 RepID=A0A5E4CUX7_MARMO|nr:hypothetical protein GHT09_013231 [Marmota monax]VTJ85635.1 Hypothetical predicted protein [Marmota monax]